jgi:uncharacterized protein with von Willebrand factor type A (vWA) domain
MRWLSVLSVAGSLLAAAPVLSQSIGSRGDSLRKENLDLPYNVVGEGDDPEDAPDLIVFYGQVYQATDVVLVLDESLTMNREGRFQIEKREANRAINELHPDSRFSIIFFGGRTTSFRRRLTDASRSNKSAAAAFVNARMTNLGTCLGEAVVEALRMLHVGGSAHPAVLLVSDGTPTRCPFVPAGGCAGRRQVVETVLSNIQNANVQRVPVHTILIGEEARCGGLAREFMTQAARLTGGTFRSVIR